MAATTPQIKIPSTVRWPVFFIILSLVATQSDDFGAVLVYNRAAIFNGDIWRLLTGHLVHFSTTHLVYDLTAVVITSWIISYRGYPHFTLLEVAAALSISLVILVFRPDLAFYGGLSGIVLANAVYLALHGLRDVAPWRNLGLGVLLLCIFKIIFDLSGVDLLTMGHNNFIPVPLSHLTGAIIGFFIYIYSLISKRSKS